MKPGQLDQLVEAVLYEGHILYPYRASSKKNRQRFTFGRIYPAAYAEAQAGAESGAMQLQVLLHPHHEPTEIEIAVRFLQPLMRDIGTLAEPLADWPPAAEPGFEWVPLFELDGALYQSWQEATEREVRTRVALGAKTGVMRFSFPDSRTVEPIRNQQGQPVAVIIRHQPAIAGTVEFALETHAAGQCRLTLRVTNGSAVPVELLEDADAVLMRTFASTHAVLQARGAEFVSLTDPPAEWAQAAQGCQNIGLWPVLVGEEAARDRDTLLASPIILPDYPQIAAESAGSLFDGCEIDEILTLRILTLTDDEKREMRHTDESARRLLERTESLSGDSLLRMHGAMRPPSPMAADIFRDNSRLKVAMVGDRPVRAGDRVRIRPRARADIMDIALDGKTAVIEAVEQDAEGRVHLAVTVEDDPGRDLGQLRQPGHRFFYGVDEVEPLDREVGS